MAKNDALQIGPVRLEDKIDPRDPNEAASFGTSSGAGSDAVRIVEAVAATYADNNLGSLLALPLNAERSQAGLVDLDEVAKVADVPKGAVVEGATVRGQSDDPEKLVVAYVVRYQLEGEDDHPERIGAGRSARGVVRYKLLPKSIKAYDKFKDTQLDAARAARSAGGSAEQFGTDPQVATLLERLEKLEKEREEYVARAEAAEAKVLEQDAAATAADPNQTAAPADGKE
jgi:hypothetical protein